MIEAIKEIGEYALEKEGKSVDNPLDILIKDPASKETYRKVLVIVLENDDSGFKYKGVDIEEYSRDNLKKYLYREGKGKRGSDFTPTSRVGKSVEGTFNKNILNWKWNDEDNDFLERLGECIQENKEVIIKDLKEEYKKIKEEKENCILTIVILENGNKKYVGDYDEVFGEILVNDFRKDCYCSKAYKTESISENQRCSICNKVRDEIYGFVGTYKFYTVDKLGFISGGFNREYAWKNYPVCWECALTLEAGRKYIKDNLNFEFYGFNYHLIPKFVFKDGSLNEVIEIIENYKKHPKFREKYLNKITDDETEILELMSEQKNYLTSNLLFYDAPRGYDGSVFNILLYVEDILPSRLKKLFDTKKDIDKISIFKEQEFSEKERELLKTRTGTDSIKFNFGVLRWFFPRDKEKGVSNKYFLECTNKIFTNKRIDYHFIMKNIMKRVRQDFIKDKPTKISTLLGFILLSYLDQLNLLKNFKEETKMEENKSRMFETDTSEDLNTKIDSFFSEFSDFFNTDAKKAVFLEGVLTQFLLNIQRLREVSDAKPGKEPFRPRLKGLKLDERHIRKLLPEIQNKLEEYGRNYYRSLESIISKYFVLAGNGWKITNDEISFYFVLGMNLSYLFKSKKEEEKQNDNE